MSMAKFNAEEVSALQAGGNEVSVHTHWSFCMYMFCSGSY